LIKNKHIKKIKVGLSLGDPNGVGLELILSIFQHKQYFKFFIPVLFAPIKIVQEQKKHFDFKTKLIKVTDSQLLIPGKLNVFDIKTKDIKLKFGEYSEKSGAIALLSLEASNDAIKKGKVDILVTAPINKKTIHSKKFHFKGHTDYFSNSFSGESLMFMVSKDLKIALITDHISIKEVSAIFSKKLLTKKIKQVLNSLKNDFGIKNAKLAILGLNPHSGENGLIGTEDELITKPVIRNYNNQEELVSGPFSADSFFGSKNYKKFDAVLAIYHDQGLIPFKTLTFGKGVNYTAGLEIIRTSPDHGSAFDIAGKGIASSSSFESALMIGREIFNLRKHPKS
tara:strand:+ start:22328 stop:23344 length:1017 start_codon:yes stop_codon:yes gene_type:complete